jgi:tRNA(adenine34) deaminase
MTDHERWMSLALREAVKAYEQHEVPVGAIVVLNNSVIGKGYNQVEMLHDATAHAEMIAITAAQSHLESKWLKDCRLYVTMEPCPMCAGAIVQARIPRLVYGATDEKAGAAGTLYNICQDDRLNHCLDMTSGLLADESAALLREFFQARR